MSWLLIALGGALGAVLRFVVDAEIKRRPSSWPRSTFVINVLGSFVLGLLVGSHPATNVSAFAVTGVCGGFTTFSTASVEAVTLLRARRGAVALLYALGSVLVCAGAIALGSAVTG